MYLLLNFFLFVKVSYFCELQQNLHVFKPYSTFLVFQPALMYNRVKKSGKSDNKLSVCFVVDSDSPRDLGRSCWNLSESSGLDHNITGIRSSKFFMHKV